MNAKLIGIPLTLALAWGCAANDRGEAVNQRQGTAEGRSAQPSRFQEGVPPSDIQRVAGIDSADFVWLAGSQGLFEVESSRYLLEQQAPTGALAVAEVLISDHKTTNDELAQLAAEKGWPMPGEMLPSHTRMLEEIQQTPDAELGEKYLEVQRLAHAEAIQLFERCAMVCIDEDLRRFAGDTLPGLREHLRRVDDLLTPGPE